MTINAWYMDSVEADQRAEHQQDPPKPASFDVLESLGVLHWSGIFGGENDPALEKIKSDRGYSYSDVVTISPDKLPNYEEKIKNFFTEHIHYDEEIRFCLEGSGYFDIRDGEDNWIRIALGVGDLIILPEGIYHRFTCDANNYIKAHRLFVGEPIWTPYNRPEIDELQNASRIKYIESFLKTSKKARTEDRTEEL